MFFVVHSWYARVARNGSADSVSDAFVGCIILVHCRAKANPLFSRFHTFM